MYRTPTRSSSKAALISLPLLVASLGAAGQAHATKVAFIGDQGTGENAQAVLSLIAAEGVDLLMTQGDFGYTDNSASQWEQNLTNILGRDFPVLSVVGNHDDTEWSSYRTFIAQRVNRPNELSCSGEPGVKALCRFANIEVVQIAPGINGIGRVESNQDFAQYIRNSFSAPTDQWRICSWHKNQNRMQTGSKGDEVGWEVFQSCLDLGAMVAMGHEHAYSRTHLLSNFETQQIVHKNNDMTLEPGKSLAFVSGLGGWDIRQQVRGGDWFASIYSASQGATHGALFCDFGDTSAYCYFKAINGAVPDQFTLRRGNNQSSAPTPTAISNPDGTVTAITSVSRSAASTGGYVFSRTDKSELRWISTAASGSLGSVWIDDACASQLGGIQASGDWNNLITTAPEIDAIANPCTTGQLATNSSNGSSVSTNNGYVFSRTDKEELRWIDRDSNGAPGNTWIDAACAQRMGGITASGDWQELNRLAPGFDAIASPCY